jgi:hypothetical protein
VLVRLLLQAWRAAPSPARTAPEMSLLQHPA